MQIPPAQPLYARRDEKAVEDEEEGKVRTATAFLLRPLHPRTKTKRSIIRHLLFSSLARNYTFRPFYQVPCHHRANKRKRTHPPAAPHLPGASSLVSQSISEDTDTSAESSGAESSLLWQTRSIQSQPQQCPPQHRTATSPIHHLALKRIWRNFLRRLARNIHGIAKSTLSTPRPVHSLTSPLLQTGTPTLPPSSSQSALRTPTPKTT